MSQRAKDIMTTNPITVSPEDSVVWAAQLMRDNDIGDVLVVDAQGLQGIITDRDIVVRAVAPGRGVEDVTVGQVASDVLTIDVDTDVADAISIMRQQAVRRLPVCQGTELVGMLSLGDLAIERDPRSALADISQAPENN